MSEEESLASPMAGVGDPDTLDLSNRSPAHLIHPIHPIHPIRQIHPNHPMPPIHPIDTLDLFTREMEKLARATPELILNTTTLILDTNKLTRLDNIHTYQCLEKVKI